MATIYKEKLVKTPTTAQLSDITRQLGFDLETAEIHEYRGQCYCTLQEKPNATVNWFTQSNVSLPTPLYSETRYNEVPKDWEYGGSL